MQAFRPLQRYFDFSGRSGRAEYWQWLATYVLIITGAFLFDYREGFDQNVDAPVLTVIIFVGSFIPNLAVSVRRLHDRSKSGKIILWLWLANVGVSTTTYLITEDPYGPLVAILRFGMMFATGLSITLAGYFIFQAASAGDEGSNEYGPPDTISSVAAARSAQPAPATAVAPWSANFDTALTSIERLGKLKEQGLISEEEFAAQKARLLGSAG